MLSKLVFTQPEKMILFQRRQLHTFDLLTVLETDFKHNYSLGLVIY